VAAVVASPDSPGASTVVIAAASRLTKQAVGVTAWVVLEDVVLDATLDAEGQAVAVTSVRRIAAHLGVSKNTVQRALTRLLAAGLLTYETEHEPNRGAITRSRYRLALDTGLAVSLDARPSNGVATPNAACPKRDDASQRRACPQDGHTESSSPPTRAADPSVRPARPVQLSLLDDTPARSPGRSRRLARR